jgi:hypothetical protein
MITALAGWFTSTSRTPVPSPLPFDDGLVELARLIAVDDPTEAARPPRGVYPDRQIFAGLSSLSE